MIVFLHIPKTAGQSVNKAIQNEVNNYIYLHGDSVIKNNIEEIQKGFTFCFVRNPWDRMVSNYFYAKKMYNILGEEKKTPTHKFRIDTVYNTDNFEEFVYWVNDNKEYALSQFHMRPQVTFIKPIQESLNFVGRYERLNDDVKELSKLISIRIKLPYINESEEREFTYEKYYNKDTKEIVEELYKEDIDILGYTYEW